MSDEQAADAFAAYLESMPADRRSVFDMIFGDVLQDHADQRILDVLDSLDLPIVMPDDDLYTLPERLSLPRELPDDHPVFFDPMGHPFPGNITDQAIAFEAIVHTPRTHFVTSLWFEGIPVWISTAYLGVNHNYFGSGPPIVWETMIQSNFAWSSWQYRYCTKTAAQASHQLITGALLKLGLTLAEAEA